MPYHHLGVPRILKPNLLPVVEKLLAGGKAESTLTATKAVPMAVGAGDPHTVLSATAAVLLATRKYVPASRKKDVEIGRNAAARGGLLTVSENSASTPLAGVPGPIALVTCNLTTGSGPVPNILNINGAISVIVAATGKVGGC